MINKMNQIDNVQRKSFQKLKFKKELDISKLYQREHLSIYRFCRSISKLGICLIIVFSLNINLFAQRQNRGIFSSEVEWILNEDIYTSFRNKDYSQCAILTDSLLAIDSNNVNGYILRGALAHDKMGSHDRVLEILNLLNKVNTSFCTLPRTEQLTFSDKIIHNEEFKSLCPIYPRLSDTVKVLKPELRDKLMELIIWTHSKKQEHFVKLGYERFYDTKPDLNPGEMTELIWNKTKNYISTYGYPTIEDVGSEWIMTMTFLTVAHRPELEDLLLFRNEMKDIILLRRLALLDDKISVASNKPQLYGTQIDNKLINGERCFYPIHDFDKLNERRMKLGLQPIESYAKQYGVTLNQSKQE